MEITKQSHITDREESLADAVWQLQQWQDGAYDDRTEEFVAVYRKQAVGFGNDPSELRRTFSQKFNVSLQRIIVDYIGSDD